MPSQEEFDELKGRIIQLENQLQAKAAKQDVSAEEMQTYIKVRDIVALEACWAAGGIRCFASAAAIQCFACWGPCVNECACGPCNVGRYGASAVQRFGYLGG